MKDNLGHLRLGFGVEEGLQIDAQTKEEDGR